jgi:hypothetical protein
VLKGAVERTGGEANALRISAADSAVREGGDGNQSQSGVSVVSRRGTGDAYPAATATSLKKSSLGSLSVDVVDRARIFLLTIIYSLREL